MIDDYDLIDWQADAPTPVSRAAIAIGCIVGAAIIIGARAAWLHLFN